MVEVGIAEYFGMAEALGIIATMIVVLYFSRKQMQALSVDIETKILNDLDERIHGITQMGVERPELVKVVSNVPSDYSTVYTIRLPCSVYACTCISHEAKRCSIR
jgi:hypothetical protein